MYDSSDLQYVPSAAKKTRQTLINTALPLFLTHGYNGIGINQILKTAKLSKGAFYHHFSSKIELYEEAVSPFFLDPVEQLDLEQMQHLPLKEIRKLLSIHYSNMPNHISKNSNIDMTRYLASYFEAQSLLPSLKASLEAHYNRLIELIANKTNQEREIFPKVATAHARNIIGALEGQFLLDALVKK